MKAIVLEEPGKLMLTDLPAPPKPGPGEALVRVHRVGICGTDYHAFRGRQPFFSYPRLIGHELGVEIVELGSPSDELCVGDACAVEPYLNCGDCIACRHGKTNCCVSLRVLGVHTDGGLREQFVVPMAKLHVSKQLTFDQLALVETLGIGAHAVSRAALQPGETVLVIGAGPIGLSVMQFALQAGARVIVMDANPARLEFCRTQLGVEETLRAGPDVVQSLQALTGGDFPTAVFDATGNPDSMRAAFDFVAPGGKLVLVGLYQGRLDFHDPDFHRRELTLLASRNATAADFQRIIQLLETGAVDTRPWLTHRASIGEMTAAFDSWLQPESGVIKAVVEL